MRISRIVGAALLALLFASQALAQTISQAIPPGSFLVYPDFDWRANNATQLRITNTHDALIVGAKLNFVCPGVIGGNQTCRTVNRSVVLTPHQTSVINLADVAPPCRRGFAVAFAARVVNAANNVLGEPIAFNHLIGSWNITRGTRLAADAAYAIPSVQTDGTVLGTGTPRALRFTGVAATGDYAALGSQLYTDFRGTNAAGTTTSNLALLSLDTRGGQPNPITSVALDHWNAVEVPFSGSNDFVCWNESDLADLDASFTTAVLGTDVGSLTITPLPNCPIAGACPPFAEYDPVILGAVLEQAPSQLSGKLLYSDTTPKGTVYVPR